MSAAENLLARLEGVRQTAPARWVSRCPAHSGSGRSLSVRELDDGRILIHDFAGCAAPDVVAALGLTLGDLFPERLAHSAKPTRPNHWHAAREALRSLDHDVLLIAIGAEAVANGEALSAEDRHHLTEAASRLREARRAAA